MMIDKNLPNYLTIFRIMTIPVIILTFYFENSKLAHKVGAMFFAFASISDFFDGYLARKFNLVSSFGKMFDPIADKLLVGSVIIMLVKTHKADEIPCLLILAREFVVAGLREFLAQVRVSLPVSRLAKIKTFVQMFALTLLIFSTPHFTPDYINLLARLSLWIAAFLTLITGYSYFKACSKYF